MCKLTNFILLSMVKHICPDRSAQVPKSRICSEYSLANYFKADLLNRRSLIKVKKVSKMNLAENRRSSLET